MNIIDIVCIVFLALWFVMGAKKGLLHGILRVVVMFVCLLASYVFCPYVSKTLSSFVQYGAWLDRAVFVGTFLFITVAVNNVVGRFLDNLGSSNRIGTGNRVAGAFLGGAQGLLYAAAGLMLLSAVLSDGNKIKDMIASGKVTNKITDSIAISYGSMDKLIRKTGINPFLNEVEELIIDNE